MDSRIAVTLDFERETKRTCLYKAVNSNSPVPNIYIMKDALGDVYPDRIEVTIEAVEKS